ncbi:MAG: hypothetical protein ABJF10_22535 [Chthoniobacter sp.]|uniref:hypothetical protein n=1 Tax=Chthoniobacter sp. TaxID=2510640 RepID=UPI0032A9124B
MSLGTGTGCDTQFLFSDDILGDYVERPPRHAEAYRRGGGLGKAVAGAPGELDFAAEHRRLQEERIAAFREYIADVNEGRFPERSHLVEMEAPALEEVVRVLGGVPPSKQD